jgi:hypothetical protein
MVNLIDAFVVMMSMMNHSRADCLLMMIVMSVALMTMLTVMMLTMLPVTQAL